MENSKKKNCRKKSVVLSADENSALQKLNQFRIMSGTEVPEEKYVFTVQGVGCMPIGDLSAVKAAPKNGKTTVIKRICGVALMGKLGQLESDLKNPNILWIDTEQKMADTKLIISDIKQMTGLTNKYLDKHLFVYSLRKIDCKTMLDEVNAAIKAYQPKVIVIDGIADFVDSVNDEIAAKNLIQNLMVASEEYDCAIICVLHENRGGNREMKGHTGAQLTQKAGVVIETNKKGSIIYVSCTDSRHQSAPVWSISFDNAGNIVDTDGNISSLAANARPSNRISPKKTNKDKEKDERIKLCTDAINEHNGTLSKNDLIKHLMDKKHISRSRASAILTEFDKNNILCVNEDKTVTLPSPSVVEAVPNS